MKLLIDIPNIIRDAYSLVYLKLLLEKEGYNVFLTSGEKLTFFTLFKHLPEVVILPQVEEIKGASIAMYMKYLQGKVIIIPTEGAAYPKSDNEKDMFFSRKYTKDYNKAIDFVLSWTDGFKRAFSKYAGVEERKIKVVGNIRFDFYRDPLKKILMNKEEFCRKYKINKKRKIVTLATHFTYADINLEYVKRYGKHVESFEFIKKRYKMETFVRDKIVKNIVKLSKEIDAQFIIKLHPWEDIQTYMKLTRNTNIILIKNEYIANVINNSDVWLHVDCTTAKEATIMGKPVITLLFWPKEFYEYDDPNFAFMCDMATSYIELKEKIISYLNGERPKITNTMIEHIENRFGKIDGKAGLRAKDEIKKFIENEDINVRRKIPNYKLLRNMVKYDAHVIVKNFIYENRTLRNTWLKLKWHKPSDYLMFLEKEIYSKKFDEYIKDIENKIKNVGTSQ